MKTVVVLAMHGSPPKDFPRDEMMEFFGLHARLEQARGAADPAARQRHDALEAKMRAWPRTAENDPFFAASQAMARSLGQETGYEVTVGFNEFCAPDLDAAIDRAVDAGAGQVVVVTPMLTRGGEHAELEIAQIVEQAQERHPGVSIRYAWPFKVGDIARFLAAQISRFV
jgi:sirohydrochlorin cobaltochelatase